MAQQWFVSRSGKEYGPYSPKSLKDMAARGQIRPDDLVRRGDMQAARAAKTVKGLFAVPQDTALPQAVLVQPPKPPAKKKERWQRVVGAIFIVVALLWVVGKFAGKKPVATEKAQAASEALGPAIEKSNDVLTSKFLPFEPGHIRHYEEEVHDPVSGRVTVHTEETHTFGKDGVIIVEYKISSAGDPPSTSSREQRIRVSGGYVEVGTVYDEIVQWVRLVKLGAKPGDVWEDGCNTGTYQFMRFRKQASQTAQGQIELVQAVLRHKWRHADKDGIVTEIETEVVLEIDSGVVSEKAYMVSTDQPRLVRQRLLVSSHH
jgi:hypothetical protein